jgi:predicted transcriptional regulator
MELHLTPEQEKRLEEIAQHHGVTPGALVTEVARGLLEEDNFEGEIIRQRLAQADAGEFIEEEEMDRRVQAMLQPR